MDDQSGQKGLYDALAKDPADHMEQIQALEVILFDLLSGTKEIYE